MFSCFARVARIFAQVKVRPEPTLACLSCRLRGIGIRIEDDILITEGEPEVSSQDTFAYVKHLCASAGLLIGFSS
jgi:hypothetical protein